jgi:hypothetical protein
MLQKSLSKSRLATKFEPMMSLELCYSLAIIEITLVISYPILSLLDDWQIAVIILVKAILD